MKAKVKWERTVNEVGGMQTNRTAADVELVELPTTCCDGRPGLLRDFRNGFRNALRLISVVPGVVA
jgi:hypothetical protein